jgi:hypothetical protein
MLNMHLIVEIHPTFSTGCPRFETDRRPQNCTDLARRMDLAQSW